MNTKYADLLVKKSVDYNNEVVKALEDAGFILVMVTDTTFATSYIVAKAESEDKNK